MSHRRCPKCGKTFEEPARFCAQDGTPLVALAGEAPPARTLVRPAAQLTKPRTNERAGSLSNELLDGRYQVGKKLGEGGMSYVYLAREASTGQSVAIKVLSPRLSGDKSSVERLRREAGLAMRLDHPNVCRILRLGETEDGIIYLVMPYLPGDLLSDREVAKTPITLDAGLAWLVQMCHGLQHAHDLQIIHRDLKPENIMLVPDNDGPSGSRAVVMDFGLAKERRQEPELAKLTATGIVLGTPEFMSPEQIRGKAIDGRSDVYALGILAFEMFTGQLPFEGKSAQEMMIARLRGKARTLRSVKPEMPQRLEAALARAMSLEPEERFPSMTAFAEALQASEESGIFAKLFRAVIRSAAFDPPEYAGWTPEPGLTRQYQQVINSDPNRKALIQALDRDVLVEIYRRLVRARLIDQALARWVRQGTIAKAWLATGEEACTAGPVFALDPRTDYVLPVIRNHAANADFGLPLVDLFRTYLGSGDGPSAGRDIHLGSPSHHVIPPISSTGAMAPVALGVALAMKIQKQLGVALTWIGDGTTKSGPTHEALNMAAVQRVPAVFIIQNNQVALGTPLGRHHLAPDFGDWPEAYGMAGGNFDGNHVLDAWAATALAVERCRRGDGPVMLVAETFRMGGHATHDEREARAVLPAELFQRWGQRDPIGLYEEYLKGRGVSAGELSKAEEAVRGGVDRAAESASAGYQAASGAGALTGVYAS